MLHGWAHQIPSARDCHGCDLVCKLSQNSDVTQIVVNGVSTLHMLTGWQSPWRLEQLKQAGEQVTQIVVNGVSTLHMLTGWQSSWRLEQLKQAGEQVLNKNGRSR